ncbi:MAG: hypothetical protein AAB906_02425 [Patescibacteria group bacterium]
MLKIATTKEVTRPAAKTPQSFELNSPALFKRSRPVAANMVGKAKRKENFTIVFLFTPNIRPPMIVAAERERPGMIAKDWKMPIKKDCFKEIAVIS